MVSLWLSTMAALVQLKLGHVVLVLGNVAEGQVSLSTISLASSYSISCSIFINYPIKYFIALIPIALLNSQHIKPTSALILRNSRKYAKAVEMNPLV
jgi:hypothetical protein